MSHAFKALRAGRKATHAGDFTWPEPGVWVEVEGELVACSNGLHVCPNLRQILTDWLSDELWLVEVDDTDRIDLADKSVVRRARLVRQLMDARSTRHFAADCAESVLPIFGRERPGDDRPRRAIETARAFADGRATSGELAAARFAAAYAADAAADAAREAAYAAREAADAAADAADAAAAQLRRLALYAALGVSS